MKVNSPFRLPLVRAVAIALLGLVTLPTATQARPRHYYGGHHGGYHHHGSYYSYPRASFGLSFGTGWLGSGYYYGPPGVPYYYERPGVSYYRSYSSVPRAYYGGSYYGRCRDVQRALYGRGYYRGPIDGIYGPGTRSAIIGYRSRHGLRVTAVIDRPLLGSLGLW